MPHQSTKIPLVCATCGASFLVYQSRARLGKAKFCSRPCRTAGEARPFPESFWEKVNKTESCWLWTAGRNKGYGGARRADRSPAHAHRIAWELTNGDIPEGFVVCHNCPGGDNPLCVNPAHMFLGTIAENIKDAAAKGRTSRGEGRPLAKLTEEQVLEIRALYAKGGITHVELASRFNVSPSLIGAVIQGKRWKHI